MELAIWDLSIIITITDQILVGKETLEKTVDSIKTVEAEVEIKATSWRHHYSLKNTASSIKRSWNPNQD